MTRAAALPDPEVGVWLRLYIYGLHGFLIEVLFTAVWDFVLHRDWALVGEYQHVLSQCTVYILTSRVVC